MTCTAIFHLRIVIRADFFSRLFSVFFFVFFFLEVVAPTVAYDEYVGCCSIRRIKITLLPLKRYCIFLFNCSDVDTLKFHFLHLFTGFTGFRVKKTIRSSQPAFFF